jgi:ABC-type multidrug transport system fused ATPase/permease subunit
MTLTRLLFSRAFTGWRLVLLWILGGCTILLALVMPQQVGRLTNLFTHQATVSWSAVRNAVTLMILAQLAISVLSYVRRRVQAVHKEYVTRTLTLTIFSRVLKFSADFFRESEVAKINSRILDDGERVSGFWVDATVGVPQSVISVIFYGWIMIARSPLLGCCMVPLSLLSAYYLFFDRRIQSINRKARQSYDRIRADSHEIISSVAEFRGHAAFDYGTQNLNRGLLEYQGVMIDSAKLSALFLAASPLIACVQTGILYFLGAWLCLRGGMQWGDVIAFLLIAQLFQRPVSDVASFGLSWRMSRESLRRIGEILQRPCAFDDLPAAPPLPEGAAIQFDSVSVATESGGLILNSLADLIPPGQHAAMCGPAGCGKTTAIQLIVRNGSPSSGRLALADKPVESYDIRALARRIGMVPQRPAILNKSLRNNILLSLRRGAGNSDAEGPLDISYTAAEVDRRLVQVIRDVGLEEDVFRKCMEFVADPKLSAANLTRRLAEIRGLIAANLHLAADDFVPFSRQNYFPGTVGENIFGPGFASAWTPQSAAVAFAAALKSSPVYGNLLKLGWVRLRREQTLAVRVLQRAPGLIHFLSPRRDADVPLGNDLNIAALPSHLQAEFLQAAFDEDAQTMPDGERQQILDARKALIDADPRAAERWQQIESHTLRPGLTIRENLLRGRCNPRRRDAAAQADAVIHDAAAQLGLLDDCLLLGLEFRAGEEGNFLSGGQRQKLALARILMKDPSILLLDEATSAMDEVSQRRVVDLVRTRFAEKTVLAISHRLETVRDFDRILVLDRGSIVESGKYDALATRGGLFSQLIRHESAKPGPDTAPSQAASLTGVGFHNAEIARQFALCPLFADLPSDRLGFLAQIARLVTFRPGEILFNRGDAGEDIFILLEGEVEFFMPAHDGAGDKPVTRYKNGRAFGELAVFGQGVRSLSARATAPCRVAAISRAQLLPIMAAEPPIALAMLKALSQRIVELTDTQVA